MAPIYTIRTLHDQTPFNGSADKPLEGNPVNSQSYETIFCWCTPEDGYDGTLQFEVSPDGGATWIVSSVQEINDIGDYVNSITFAGGDVRGFVIITPEVFDIRARMSGGSAGTLTVKARSSDGRF